jgi:hypothetical protein
MKPSSRKKDPPNVTLLEKRLTPVILEILILATRSREVMARDNGRLRI